MDGFAVAAIWAVIPGIQQHTIHGVVCFKPHQAEAGRAIPNVSPSTERLEKSNPQGDSDDARRPVNNSNERLPEVGFSGEFASGIIPKRRDAVESCPMRKSLAGKACNLGYSLFPHATALIFKLRPLITTVSPLRFACRFALRGLAAGMLVSGISGCSAFSASNIQVMASPA